MKELSIEDKELLLKDLCARLPYHVRCKVWLKDGTTEEGSLDLVHNYADVLRDAFYYNKIKDIKPYLRPMSSMTEEEREELSHYENSVQRTDFYYSHHIDCRYMIENDLAIEAPDNMYKIG